MRTPRRYPRLSRRTAALALALPLALAAGCTKNPEPEPSATPERTAQSPAAPQKPAAPAMPAKPQGGSSELAWDVPAGWETAPNPSAMRKATYKIKRADGDAEDAELSVSQAGGSVDQNVQRWVGQFKDAKDDAVKKAERKVGDLKVTVVDIRGTFAGSGMPGMPAGEPKPSWAMLGAIVETPGGGSWFFKMTGPEKTVTGARADFDKLVDSLRPK